MSDIRCDQCHVTETVQITHCHY